MKPNASTGPLIWEEQEMFMFSFQVKQVRHSGTDNQ